MDNVIGIMFTTLSSIDDATKISKLLIEEKLAACIQIEMIQSMYEWKNEFIVDNEYRLLIKYLIENENNLIKRLKQIHPYENPEIIYSDMKVNESYLKWCYTVTRKK